jgi:hypothetical protein
MSKTPHAVRRWAPRFVGAQLDAPSGCGHRHRQQNAHLEDPACGAPLGPACSSRGGPQTPRAVCGRRPRALYAVGDPARCMRGAAGGALESIEP